MTPNEMLFPSAARRTAVITTALWLVVPAPPSAAEEAASKGGVELPDLAKVKQEEAREKLERLEETMDRLSRLLAQSEPQNAAKLRTAFKEARDRLVREGMDRIVGYLEAKKLDRAIEDQDRIKVNLQEILDILLEKDIDPRELLKHIRRVRDILTGLDKVVEDETKEKMASDDAEQAGATSNALEGDLAKLEDLIRREKALEGKTADPALASDDKLPGLAPEQGKVREETEGLRKSDEERTASAAEGGKPEGAKPQEGAPPPGGGQPPPEGAEGARPGEAEAQPGRAPPPEGGEPGRPARPEPPPAKPGPALDRKVLEKAERAMDGAEQAMKGGDRGRAAAKTKEARTALEEAVGSGREELERLRANREWKKLKDDQDRTKGEADAIAERMKVAPPLMPPEGGVPGQAEVQQAAGDMAEASSELGRERPRRASGKQADSLDKLKEGRAKTEEALEELQRALRERILAYLREKFTKMLAEQRAVTRETRSLDLKLRALKAVQGAAAPGSTAPTASVEGPEIDRKDRQLAEALAAREAGIGALADDVIDLLSEDGTTLVFPGVVEEVKRDIANVSGLLSRIETGERTQHIEREIEVAIEEILKALEQAQRSPPPPNPSQGRQSRSGAGPLLPLSAELKMVRSLQARVNERTRAFDLGRKPDLGPEDKLQLHAIQTKQKEIETMLRKLRTAAGER